MDEHMVEVEVTGKPWWKSKIIWTNVLGGAAEIAQMLSGVGLLPVGTVSLVVNGVTIVLRRISGSEPIQPILGNAEPQTIQAVVRPQPMKFVARQEQE